MRPTRLLIAAVLLSLLAFPVGAQSDPIDDAYSAGMRRFAEKDYAGAVPYFEEAVALARERYGPDDPSIASDLSNLGEVYRRVGRLDDAEALLQEAIALDRQEADADAGLLATSYNNLALIYRAQDRLAEAEPLYKSSLALLEKARGPYHPDVAAALNNLAVLYQRMDLPERALPLFERAHAITERSLGPDHPTTRTLAANLAELQASLAASAPPPPAPALAEEKSAPPQRPSRVGEAAPPSEPAPSSRPVRLAESNPRQKRHLPPPDAYLQRVPAPTQVAAADSRIQEDAPAPPARPSVAAVAPVPARPGAAGDVSLNSEGRDIAAVAPEPPPRRRRPPVEAFGVHVASVKDRDRVAEAWSTIADRNPVLRNLRVLPPVAVTTDKGDFWRVVGGLLPSREQASAVCARLAKTESYCHVVVR